MKKTFLFSIFAMAMMSLAVFTSCTDDSPSGVEDLFQRDEEQRC